MTEFTMSGDDPGDNAHKVIAGQEIARPRRRRAIVFGVLAAGAILVAQLGDPYGSAWEDQVLAWAGTICFTLFGFASLISFGGEIRRIVGLRVGPIHATVIRLAIVLSGGVVIIVTTLALLSVPISQLVLGGAVTGAILGIAGQQTLANLFAGIVLLYSRPFKIGEQIHARSGPLGGDLHGRVVEIGLVYVRLETDEGEVSVPNAVMQSAAVSHFTVR